MGPEATVTVAGVGLIVAALAVYLTVIAYQLTKISFTLGTVLIGVRAIAARCEPIGGLIRPIVDDVAVIEAELSGLAEEMAAGAGYGEQEEPERPRRRRRAREGASPRMV